MSYLSRRMREIREEEERRVEPIRSISIGRVFVRDLVYPPMPIIDPGMHRIMNEAIEQYEATLAARNPHMRESISWKGRAG